MGEKVSGWPDELDDEGAMDRLQSILLLGCEGNQDLSRGRDYKAMRRALLDRSDLADVVPRFVRSQRDLSGFWTYIKNFAPSYEQRRVHVRENMTPLFDRVEGHTRPPVRSNRWTGKRTASQQAQVVLALGFDALAGVDALLDEQERPLHNGGPIEPERLEAIEHLKALHAELGELIRLAEAELPLDDQLRRVRSLKDQALSWVKSPAGFAAGMVPLTGFSCVLGVGVYYLVNAIAPEAASAMAAATTGAHVTGATILGARESGSR